ncbi:interleukin-12 receptor subunit beta-2 [Danio rerio]|uniref:Interleukin 12 receptor beta 2.a n=1 Tax=Danio rerio TaxID=7955 RepID=A8WH97_DANRE|nr:interleukin-12 receptor subunit beta-2 [Danio rerio]CAJ44286.2 TPA: interleukin 12 receptor beta 2.a [Danio rerio]|eukprot:NP_001106977.1 interleukin-12 receptor subunit beta-2 [Danio rerio]
MHLAGTVCTVRSSTGKEVLLGSNFTVSCIFNKPCTKQLFRNNEPIKYELSPRSREVFVYIRNLTTLSIFTCKCNDNPEPCGIDITPGYPPNFPQNLTCIRKTEFGNVSCTWTTGRDTKIVTTCQLRVQGDPHHGYESVMNSSGFCWATFPIKSRMSQLTVSLNVSNSLGSNTSVQPSLPKIKHVDCSSRWCHLHTDNHSMNLVEVQYKSPKGIWKKVQINGKKSLNISLLEPYTKYMFQIRRKINQTMGLWSYWSQAKEAETKEEAPDKVLDFWYLRELKPSQSEKCFRIFWKELSVSDAKGKIHQYDITVKKGNSREIIVVPRRINESICCSDCSVSVSAVNSMGQSPENFIKLQTPHLVSGFLSHKSLSNHSIALSWPRLAIAGNITEYVVHWYPVGDIEEIQWIRVVDTKANITGLRPQECFQGAVTALTSNGPVASNKDLSTWQSAPEQGPVPQQVKKKTESLIVKWSKIPQEKRGGCLKKYTVYLMDKSKGEIHHYSVDYPLTEYIISGLSPGQCYNLWVTAWTDAGEGPRGSDLPFCTPTDTERLLSLVILAGGAVLFFCLFLICICQFSSVQRRFLSCFQCLLPRVIPDPANSKCAKTYDKHPSQSLIHTGVSPLGFLVLKRDKNSTHHVQTLRITGIRFAQSICTRLKEPLRVATVAKPRLEILFYLQQYDSSMSEEPENVEVEEVPYHPSFTCTYIKSFSQESDSSDATQITRNTDISEDYISTHGAISGGEEEEDEEKEMGLDEFEFFPSIRSPFLEPLVSTGGKLTLDVVKIDCSEFLDCT